MTTDERILILSENFVNSFDAFVIFNNDLRKVFCSENSVLSNAVNRLVELCEKKERSMQELYINGLSTDEAFRYCQADKIKNKEIENNGKM